MLIYRINDFPEGGNKLREKVPAGQNLSPAGTLQSFHAYRMADVQKKEERC